MIDGYLTGAIGECMRRLRRHLGWRQAELARAATMSATALSRIETGKMRPDVTTVRVLLGIMGFSGDASRLLEILMKSGFL
jgi:transcriptional regulator with XRE-family HTH domain